MATERRFCIKGPAGALDVRVSNGTHSRLGLLMCHPHPLFQGSMDNKVVTTATRAAQELGLATLRFNFRGVGQSEGQHDHGLGEQDDVRAVLAYALNELGWQRVILAGFSFGSGMACLVASTQPEHIAALALVAPPVHHFDAPRQLPYEFATQVYMGDVDEVVPFDEVNEWVNLVSPSPDFHVFSGAGHYFHGRLTDLKASFLDDWKALL